jgi:hypothetical protein
MAKRMFTIGVGLRVGVKETQHLPQVRVGVKTNHPAYEFGASAPTNMVRAFKNAHRVAYLELNGVSHVLLPTK